MANNEIYPSTIPDCFARSHFWSFDCQKCRFSNLCMSKEECLQQSIYLTDLALKSYTADLAHLIICRATGMDEKRADIEQAELEKHIRDYEDMLSTLTEIYDRRQEIDFLMEDEADKHI